MTNAACVIAAEPEVEAPVGRPERRPLGTMYLLVALYLVLVTVGIGFAMTGSFDSGLRVTRQEYGAAWPLTVSDGVLHCQWRREITFQRRGTTYILNGRVEHGAYADVASIRAMNPGGEMKDLSPLIARGLSLCH